MLDFFKGTVTPKDWAFVAIVLAIAAALCTLFFFFVFTPQKEALAAASKDLDELKSQLQAAHRARANIDELREEARKMDLLVERFEQRLPEEREIQKLMENFESFGDKLGIRVSIAQMPSTTDASKETIPYKVTVQGDFHRIVSFINYLERDDRYLRISDLDINEEQAGISLATFTVSTFRFIQATAAPPATGASK